MRSESANRMFRNFCGQLTRRHSEDEVSDEFVQILSFRRYIDSQEFSAVILVRFAPPTSRHVADKNLEENQKLHAVEWNRRSVELTVTTGTTSPKKYNLQCLTVDVWYGCINDSSSQKKPRSKGSPIVENKINATPTGRQSEGEKAVKYVAGITALKCVEE